MPDNLVPKQVVRKDGVLTTVWVRPDGVEVTTDEWGKLPPLADTSEPSSILPDGITPESLQNARWDDDGLPNDADGEYVGDEVAEYLEELPLLVPDQEKQQYHETLYVNTDNMDGLTIRSRGSVHPVQVGDRTMYLAQVQMDWAPDQGISEHPRHGERGRWHGPREGYFLADTPEKAKDALDLLHAQEG